MIADNETHRAISLLVIEDDPVIRETLQHVFSTVFQCDVSDGSAQVLQKLEERKYDVIITDVSMPDIDGVEALKRIHARDPTTPVIVISGKGDAFRDEFMEMGAFAYLSKPFILDELEAAVLEAARMVR